MSDTLRASVPGGGHKPFFPWTIAWIGLVSLTAGAAGAAEAQPAKPTGTLKVTIVGEAGQPLPARVHLRDADGRYLLAAGQSTRQRAVYKGTQPIAGDWFYTSGNFGIDVIPGRATIDVAHGPAFTTAHEVVPIVAGKTAEKTYTLRRLIDPAAKGWYGADEHLHQPPDSSLMLAEDLNLTAIPICGGVDLRYRPDQRVAQLPDATHLLVSQVPAVEWDCFLWNLPKPLDLRLDDRDWPQEDGATSDRPGGPNDLRTVFIVRAPFLIERAHAAGATTIAYMHDPPRLWWYPLYVANGWVDVYGVLENAYCSTANRTEAEFWRGFDGANGNFAVWYRFLNCGYRLPASAGTDNIGMGVGVWKGYNRVYTKVDGPFTAENWLAALKQGRSFVTNRPLLFATVAGKDPGSAIALASAAAGAPPTVDVDVHVVSATPISRIDVLHQGRVLKQIDVDPPSGDVRRKESLAVPGSGWLAVRCLGRGDNPNLSPAWALAHTSPFYAIVDGQLIRSPEDARYLHAQFSAFVERSLPRVKNDQIRQSLEAKCRDALAKYAALADAKEPGGKGAKP